LAPHAVATPPQTARPESSTTRYYTWEQREFFGKIDLEGPLNRRTFPLIGLDLQLDVMAEKNRRMPRTTDSERREKEAMAVVVSTYEPTEIRFGGFRAPLSGRYRLRLSGYSVRMAAISKVGSQRLSRSASMPRHRPEFACWGADVHPTPPSVSSRRGC
jgi:hypothetical protein